MNRLVMLLLLAALVLGFVFFRARSAHTPVIEPHAASEIHKAQQR